MSAEVVARDEVGDLKAALVRGEWVRLTDPLLPLILWTEAGSYWWRAAQHECLWPLMGLLPRCPRDLCWEMAYNTTYWPEDRDVRGAYHPRTLRVLRAWALDRVRSAALHRDVVVKAAALAVLVRYPPR